MTQFLGHQHETDRISTLKNYEILDTFPEREFDDLVKLAQTVFDAPIALISFVDSDRQWFKAKIGLDICETPREQSFCSYAINDVKPLVVEDATVDPRFADNPLVIGGPRIRFYAGAPLMLSSGFQIGALCVIDTKPRKKDEKQIELLTILAKQVVDQLNRRANQKLIEQQRAQIVEKLKIAALGEMAAGIAHEINNPLAIIQASVAGLYRGQRDRHDFTPEFHSKIKLIDATVSRIAKIVKGLKQFAQEESRIEVEGVSVSDLISDTLVFCHERFREGGVKISIDPCLPTMKAYCNSVQISQVLLNLLNNSFDSVSELDERWINVSFHFTEAVSQIRVTDSGPPIASSIVSKMFNPFFTTKEVGKGTGLGLSVSKGILESHHGSLSYSVHEGHPRFTISLPVQKLNAPRTPKSEGLS